MLNDNDTRHFSDRDFSVASRANTGGIPAVQLESLNDEIAAVLSASNSKNGG